MVIAFALIIWCVKFPTIAPTWTSQLNFLALLGTIIGAVMAAAGIIVALISIYSFYTIEQRVQHGLDEAANKFLEIETERLPAKAGRFYQSAESRRFRLKPAQRPMAKAI